MIEQSTSELRALPDDDDFGMLTPPQWRRCERCAYSFGRPNQALVSCLRCPACDYPFGETLPAMRAIAYTLQGAQTRVDVFSTVGCFIWLQVILDGDELAIDEIGDEAVGTPGEWFHHECDNATWADILGMSNDRRGVRWLLENGLCLKQPFLLEFRQPRYVKTGWEYEEYDVEYEYDIVQRSRVTARRAAQSLERLVRRFA